MNRIEITKNNIQATILPDFGGTVAHLKIGGVDVLRMDEGLLGVSNTLAGGIPVLFPFVSATPDHTAQFLGKSYTMPVHGFVKDLPFDVICETDSSCEIMLKSNAVTRHFYPYDFELYVAYEIVEDGLKTTLRVKNTGDEVMPFAAGFHPYFYTPDRSKTRFIFDMKQYLNFLKFDEHGNPESCVLDGELRLADEYDAVFYTGNPNCEIICDAPSYRVRMECGETLNVITVCTNLENASCVEPWQACPGAAHRPDDCRKLNPGGEESCSYILHLE